MQCSPSGSLNPTPLCASSRALVKAARSASPLRSSAPSCHKAPAMQELRHSGCAQLPARGQPTLQVRATTLVCAHSATYQPISAPSLGLVRGEALPPSARREGHSVLPQPPCLYSVLQSTANLYFRPRALPPLERPHCRFMARPPHLQVVRASLDAPDLSVSSVSSCRYKPDSVPHAHRCHA